MSRSRKKNPYRKSRRFDKSCRCNGGCGYCYTNRFHSEVQRLEKAESTREEIVQDES